MAMETPTLLFVDRREDLDNIRTEVLIGSRGYVISEGTWYILKEVNGINSWIPLAAVGSVSQISVPAPVFVNSMDEMTDVYTLYVYNNHYYYYSIDNKAWTQGPEFQSANLGPTDSLKKTTYSKDLLTTPFMFDTIIDTDEDGRKNITRALKELLSNGYKDIFIPEGKYVITEPIYIPQSARICGAGNQTIIYAKLNGVWDRPFSSTFSDQSTFHEDKIDLFRMGLYSSISNMEFRIIGNFDGAFIAIDARSLSGDYLIDKNNQTNGIYHYSEYEKVKGSPHMRGTARAGISISDISCYVSNRDYSYLHCAAIRMVAGSESGKFYTDKEEKNTATKYLYPNRNFYNIDINRVKFVGGSSSTNPDYKQNWGYLIQAYVQYYKGASGDQAWSNSHYFNDCTSKDCRWMIFCHSHDAEEYYIRNSLALSYKYGQVVWAEGEPKISWSDGKEADLTDFKQNGFYTSESNWESHQSTTSVTTNAFMHQGSYSTSGIVYVGASSRLLDVFPMDWHYSGAIPKIDKEYTDRNGAKDTLSIPESDYKTDYRKYPFVYTEGSLIQSRVVTSHGASFPDKTYQSAELEPSTLKLSGFRNYYQPALIGWRDYNIISAMPKMLSPRTSQTIIASRTKDGVEYITQPTAVPTNRLFLYSQDWELGQRYVGNGPLIDIYFDMIDVDKELKKIHIYWLAGKEDTGNLAVPYYTSDKPLVVTDFNTTAEGRNQIEFFCQMTAERPGDGFYTGGESITGIHVFATGYSPDDSLQSTSAGFGRVGCFFSYPFDGDSAIGYAGHISNTYRKTINTFGYSDRKGSSNYYTRIDTSYYDYYATTGSNPVVATYRGNFSFKNTEWKYVSGSGSFIKIRPEGSIRYGASWDEVVKENAANRD